MARPPFLGSQLPLQVVRGNPPELGAIVGIGGLGAGEFPPAAGLVGEGVVAIFELGDLGLLASAEVRLVGESSVAAGGGGGGGDGGVASCHVRVCGIVLAV